MAQGDVQFSQDTNEICSIEQADGTKQRAIHVAIGGGTGGTTGGIDVNVQDQTTPPVEYFLSQTLNAVTILNTVASKENTFTLSPGHGFVVNDLLEIHYADETQGHRYTQMRIVSVVGDVVRTGQYLGFNIVDTANIVESNRTTFNMNVLGTLDTPQVFDIHPPNGLKWDLTRVILGMVLDGNPDDSKFGDIVGGVPNGMFFGTEGDATDYFLVNIAQNAGFRGTAYDVAYVTRSSPSGQYGLSVRKTFAGQDKYGVAVRLNGEANEKFVAYVQDDLTQFVEFGIKAMGHIVDD